MYFIVGDFDYFSEKHGRIDLVGSDGGVEEKLLVEERVKR